MRRWSYALPGRAGWAAPNTAPALLAPGGADVSLLPRCLSGLLPARDHNREQLDALAASKPFGGAEAWLCLFLADPWLRIDAVAELCASHRVAGVVALPSPLQYGATFAARLEAADLGRSAELRQAEALRARGLSVALIATVRGSLGDLDTAPLGFAAPSFDHWRADSSDFQPWADEAAAMLRADRPPGRDLVVFSGGVVRAADAKKWGASGFVEA